MHLIQRPHYQCAKIHKAIRPHEDLLIINSCDAIIKRRKLKWNGHVFHSSGLAKTILQGTVKGGRRQGRQKKRWEGNFREWTGLEFTNSPEKNGGNWLWNWLWCPTTLAVKGQMIRWWMCYKRWSGMTQQFSNQSHLKEYHCWPSFAHQFIEFTLHISAHATNSKTICLIITSYFVFFEERRRKVSGEKKKKANKFKVPRFIYILKENYVLCHKITKQ